MRSPEDFARYRPEELAGIAEQSWALLQERKSGAPKIRFEPAAAKPGVAVLEMINDDMPFLVDSMLGEISERDLDIRLLVHPVFTRRAQRDGQLNAFHGAHKGNGRRESFIHIHVDDDGDDAARADLVRTLADILAEVRVCVQDWRPMLARAERGHRRTASRRRRRCLPTRSPKRSSSCNGSPPTISPCSARATTPTPTASTRSSRGSTPVSACCGRRKCGSCAAAISSSPSRRKSASSSTSRSCSS